MCRQSSSESRLPEHDKKKHLLDGESVVWDFVSPVYQEILAGARCISRRRHARVEDPPFTILALVDPSPGAVREQKFPKLF